MNNSAGLMAGKKGLIMGVANNRSIAWNIAKATHDQGAELAFSYQGDALLKRVTPLAKSVGSDIVLPCDVTDEGRGRSGRSPYPGCEFWNLNVNTVHVAQSPGTELASSTLSWTPSNRNVGEFRRKFLATRRSTSSLWLDEQAAVSTDTAIANVTNSLGSRIRPLRSGHPCGRPFDELRADFELKG